MNGRLPALLLLTLACACAGTSCRRAGPAKPLIGIAAQGAGGAFATACLAAAERGAEGRAELAVMDGKGDSAAQLAQLGLLIERKASSLIASAASGADAAGLIAAAKARNVPLVLMGEQPRIEDLRGWDKVLYVGHSGTQAAAAQGALLAAAWKASPAFDANRDGRMRLVFAGPWTAGTARARGDAAPGAGTRKAAPSPADKGAGAQDPAEERRQACIDALAAAGVKVEAVEARGAAALAALVPGSGPRAEAVAADDPESAAAVVSLLETAGLMKGRSRVPVVLIRTDAPGPAAGELEAAGLAGEVSGDPGAVGKTAVEAAYAFAFRRDVLDSGFAVADGKNVLLPCVATLASDFRPATK